MLGLRAHHDDVAWVKPAYCLKATLGRYLGALRIEVVALFAPTVVKVVDAHCRHGAMLSLQAVQLKHFQIFSCLLKRLLDTRYIWSAHLIFWQVKIVAIDAVETDWVPSFAIAETRLGNTVTWEYFRKSFSFVKDFLEITLFIVYSFWIRLRFRLVWKHLVILRIWVWFVRNSIWNEITDGHFASRGNLFRITFDHEIGHR